MEMFSYQAHTADFGDRLEIDLQPTYMGTSSSVNITDIHYGHITGSSTSFYATGSSSDWHKLLKRLVLRRNGDKFEIETHHVEYGYYELQSYLTRADLPNSFNSFFDSLPVVVNVNVSPVVLMQYNNINKLMSYPAWQITNYISRFESLEVPMMIGYHHSDHEAFAEALLAATSPLYRYLLNLGMPLIGSKTSRFHPSFSSSGDSVPVEVEHVSNNHHYLFGTIYRMSSNLFNVDLAQYAYLIFGVKTKKSVSTLLKIADSVQNIEQFYVLVQKINELNAILPDISIDEKYNAVEFALNNPDKVDRKFLSTHNNYSGVFPQRIFLSREKTIRFILENPIMINDAQDMVDFIRSHEPEYKIPNAKTLTELHNKVAVEDRRIRAKLSNKPIEYNERFLELEKMEIGEGIGLSLPRRTADLGEWGKELNNCIASYADRAARGDIILIGVFVGHSIDYAIEMHPETGYVNQFYGKGNSQPPTEIKSPVMTAIHKWYTKFGNVRSKAV
jgi:hypothetical protein